MKTNQFKQRREILGSKFSETLFVIAAGSTKYRSHSVHYRFKSASDFYYLTGLKQQPDAVFILAKNKSYLLLRDVDASAVIWGDQESGLEKSQLENLEDVEIISIKRLDEIIQTHALKVSRIASVIGLEKSLDDKLQTQVSFSRSQKNRATLLALSDARPLIGILRHFKNEDEIKNLKIAGAKSSEVHTELFRQNLIGRTEREISNWIESQFLLRNMQWTSYETIVGSGARSVSLHARASDKIIESQDMVLVDAGAEWSGYCADITRCRPAGLSFSKQQKVIYQAVLSAQKAVLGAIRPQVTLNELHVLAQQNLIEQLLQSGFTKASVSEKISQLMPHSTSHWIGLDVHDPSSYVDDQGHAVKLQAGMTFTVEPGLYIREGLGAEFSDYFGIGVRIEDDVVVTDAGHESLTNVAKEIEEIEALLATTK